VPEKTGKKITTKKVVLHFPKRMVDEPILFHLIKDFDLEFNILKASITPEAEGLMVVELKGEQTQYDHGVQYLLDRGVKIQALSRDVTRNEERCTSCGACVTVCPVGAFEYEKGTMIVRFKDNKCVACAPASRPVRPELWNYISK
jgi:ferredoxin